MAFDVGKGGDGGFIGHAVGGEAGNLRQRLASLIAGLIQPGYGSLAVHTDHAQVFRDLSGSGGVGQRDRSRAGGEAHIRLDHIPFAVLVADGKVINRVSADLFRRVRECAQIGGSGGKGDVARRSRNRRQDRVQRGRIMPA